MEMKDLFCHHQEVMVNYLLKGNIRIILKVITTRSVVEISSTENENFLYRNEWNFLRCYHFFAATLTLHYLHRK